VVALIPTCGKQVEKTENLMFLGMSEAIALPCKYLLYYKEKARCMSKDFVPYFNFPYLLITSQGVWAQSHLCSGVARVEWPHVFCWH